MSMLRLSSSRIASMLLYGEQNFSELIAGFHTRDGVLHLFQRERTIDGRLEFVAFHEFKHRQELIPRSHRASKYGQLLPVKLTGVDIRNGTGGTTIVYDSSARFCDFDEL